MIEKTLIVYKGDKYMSYFYFGLASLMLIAGAFLFWRTARIGLTYLAIGLTLFGIYGLIKGILMHRIAKKRYQYYQNKRNLSLLDIKNELEYNKYRLAKKEVNRRRYIYMLLIGFVTSVLGLFLNQKGLFIGTLIPIILFTGTELTVGLLTEFRLWEYQRQLERE